MRLAALFPFALALGATIAPGEDAQAQPTAITACQTISQPGSYILVNNLTFTSLSGACLTIAASFVTIDLAGFAMGAQAAFSTTAIEAGNKTTGIAVRNGSLSHFGSGVNLAGSGSIVEGLRVVGTTASTLGIAATGIVKGNTVSDIFGVPGVGTGISASGLVTGNYATGNRIYTMLIGQGSTVVGNTATHNAFDGEAGISVDCPSNVTDNTAVDKDNSGPGGNLLLNGTGCNNTNNVAP